MSTSVKELVARAKSQIRNLSVAEFASEIDNDQVTLVDVREPDEVDRDGAIPGAIQAPRGMLEFWIDPASPYAKPIFQENKKFIFHCASGLRSALAAKTAQDMGLTPVAHLGGGFTAWRDAGEAVEKVEPKAKG